MSKEELNAYYRHLDNIVILRDNIYTERAEGRAEGREEGREEERFKIASNLLAQGIEIPSIATATGLTVDQIAQLKD